MSTLVERLRARKTEWNAELRRFVPDADEQEAADELTRLQRELEEARKDAQRYRRLCADYGHTTMYAGWDANLDARLDAAIAVRSTCSNEDASKGVA